MTTVVLPQALRRIVPPMMNSLVSLQKDVALISLIGPIEIDIVREAATQQFVDVFR